MSEALEIPPHVRKTVDQRDEGYCRVCGKFLGSRRGLHHVLYGGDVVGMGGRRRHNPDEIITVCWMVGDNGCHQRLHSDKSRWQPLALEAIKSPGVTVMQLDRWSRRLPSQSERPFTASPGQNNQPRAEG